jgi:hypothetical protein
MIVAICRLACQSLTSVKDSIIKQDLFKNRINRHRKKNLFIIKNMLDVQLMDQIHHILVL